MTTNHLSVVQVRDRLAALSDQANAAGQHFTDARDRHNQAVRAALHTNDHAVVIKTAAAVEGARQAYDRAREMVEAAELALSEAKAQERAEAQDTARSSIAAQLAEIQTLAREADGHFAAAAGILHRLRSLEAQAHRDVRTTFGTPPTVAPVIAREAANTFATYIRSVGSNHPADPAPWVENAAEASARNIRRALGYL